MTLLSKKRSKTVFFLWLLLASNRDFFFVVAVLSLFFRCFFPLVYGVGQTEAQSLFQSHYCCRKHI